MSEFPKLIDEVNNCDKYVIPSTWHPRSKKVVHVIQKTKDEKTYVSLVFVKGFKSISFTNYCHDENVHSHNDGKLNITCMDYQ